MTWQRPVELRLPQSTRLASGRTEARGHRYRPFPRGKGRQGAASSRDQFDWIPEFAAGCHFAAGLRSPSYFRLYVLTTLQSNVRKVGTLSEPDWRRVQECLSNGIEFVR